MSEADAIIRLLALKPHPEGGHYRETFRDTASATGRAHSTAIYFLLRENEVSRWHRIDAAEIWHWYAGAPLELALEDRGGAKTMSVLGSDLVRGARPQLVVPPQVWQSARSLGAYSLVGCTVAPGFAFSHLELRDRTSAT